MTSTDSRTYYHGEYDFMEIDSNPTTSLTLSETLMDQLNLDPRAELMLECLEEDLIHDISNGYTKEMALLKLKKFCRSYAGEGFYDPQNKFNEIASTWYDEISEVLIGDRLQSMTLSVIDN